jgi:hypothetical protein
MLTVIIDSGPPYHGRHKPVELQELQGRPYYAHERDPWSDKQRYQRTSLDAEPCRIRIRVILIFSRRR